MPSKEATPDAANVGGQGESVSPQDTAALDAAGLGARPDWTRLTGRKVPLYLDADLAPTIRQRAASEALSLGAWIRRACALGVAAGVVAEPRPARRVRIDVRISPRLLAAIGADLNGWVQAAARLELGR